jgi:hypothetical protein
MGWESTQSHSMLLKSLPDSFLWRLRLVNLITCNYNILPSFTIYLDRIRSVGHHSLDTAIYLASVHINRRASAKRLNGRPDGLFSSPGLFDFDTSKN